MASSFQQPNCNSSHLPLSSDLLIANVVKIHASISKLESLRPSQHVKSLFTQLVKLCTLPSPIDVRSLPPELQSMRESLIILCGRAEGLLELEFAVFMTKIPHPLDHLNIFPYHANYVELAGLEYQLLHDNGSAQPKRVAFVGSGPMPLTSIVMATHHMKATHFVNYDMDETANDLAGRLVATDAELAGRMKFKTSDVMDVREELGEFDCIFLAALVGMRKEEKVRIVEHIRKYMKSGGILLVRSANGARGFLYPIVEAEDLHDLEILSIFHPTSEVINSIVIARKPNTQIK